MKVSAVCALALALSAASSIRADEIVFENSEVYSGHYASVLSEYGDEITLGGTARTLTEFIFEYAGDFFSQGDEVGKVRFYANDNGPFHLPGTLLWESPLFPVRKGPGVTEGWANINIDVPDTFTWTVQFFGLTMNTTAGQLDVAGLRYYGLPKIGQSYNDFWIRNGDSWQLFGPPADVPKANFAVRVKAVPEPSIVALATLGAAAGIVHLLRKRSH